MSHKSWMPLYWGDYLGKTTHLTVCEHGAYLLLIGHLWTAGGSTPDDDLRLQRICRCTAEEWSRIRPMIESFFTITHGKWRHARVTAELEKAEKTYEKRAKAGRESAIKRNDLSRSPIGKRGQPQPQPQPQSEEKILHLFPSEKTENQNHTEPKKDSASPDGFAEFYAAMPKRTDRPDSIKAWNSRVVKAGIEPAIVIAAAKRYAADVKSKGTDTQYIKTPGPWLRAERWKDEIKQTETPAYHPWNR